MSATVQPATKKGAAIFLAQFIGDDQPFDVLQTNTLARACHSKLQVRPRNGDSNLAGKLRGCPLYHLAIHFPLDRSL